MESWLQVIVAVGGVKVLEVLYNMIVNFRTNKRKEISSADSAEIRNVSDTVRIVSELLEKTEKRLEVRDLKVDFLFKQLESERTEKLEYMNRSFEMERKYYESRCLIEDCSKRKPPKNRENAKKEN